MGGFSDLKRNQTLKPQINMVHEYHQSKDVDFTHIPGIINPSNIFTKEMKDNTHFRNLRDFMMIYLQDFLKYSHKVPSHIIFADKLLPYFSIRSEDIVPDSLELKAGVPEHVVPPILELQLGVRQTV